MLNFENPDRFIGMTIDKKLVSALCIGFENYTTKEKTESFLLIWDCVSKLSGKAFTQKTGWKNFTHKQIANHPEDKDPTRVFWGKIGAEKKKSK